MFFLKPAEVLAQQFVKLACQTGADHEISELVPAELDGIDSDRSDRALVESFVRMTWSDRSVREHLELGKQVVSASEVK